jgi:hypothetical protein
MNAQGAEIPTAWLLLVPFVNYYWYWKYSQGAEHVTNGKLSAPLTFIMLLFISVIGMAVVQSELNKVSGSAPIGMSPQEQSYASQPTADAFAPQSPIAPAASSSETFAPSTAPAAFAPPAEPVAPAVPQDPQFPSGPIAPPSNPIS